jgi:hypothetical protein
MFVCFKETPSPLRKGKPGEGKKFVDKENRQQSPQHKKKQLLVDAKGGVTYEVVAFLFI